MNDEVVIEEWAEGERLRLSDFIRMWKESRSINPENYPEKMPEGEWDEQFRAFEG